MLFDEFCDWYLRRRGMKVRAKTKAERAPVIKVGTTRTTALRAAKRAAEQEAESAKARRAQGKQAERQAYAGKIKKDISTTMGKRNNKSLADREAVQKQQREEYLRGMAAKHRENKKELRARLKERPSLMGGERSKGDRARNRKKAIMAMKASLDAAGITDYARFFDAQELRDLGVEF